MVPNEKNLQPLNKRTKSEQRRIQSDGGKASGESRRQRKALRENMNALLDLPVSNTRDFNRLSTMGVDVEDINNSQLLTLGLFLAAKNGDVQAFKEIRDLVGEKRDDSQLDKLDALLEEFKNVTQQ